MTYGTSPTTSTRSTAIRHLPRSHDQGAGASPQAGPGSYVYLPPGVRHDFSVETAIGRVYNMLCPAGFDKGIVEGGTPAPRIPMHAPGTSSLPIWNAQLRASRPPAPWETGADPTSWRPG